MRKSLKSIAIASAAVLALSAFTGCSPTVDHEQVDSSRTQLYVSDELSR